MVTRQGTVLLHTSLVVNVLVLGVVVPSLLLEAGWVADAFGPPSPARSILLAIYVAIFVLSIALLVQVRMGRDVADRAAALLAVQVIYKLLSPMTVGDLLNPVVLSNLAIAALHLATLLTLRRRR